MARPKGHPISRQAWDDISNLAAITTITELSELTGIQRATLSGIIGGHHRASLVMAKRIADAIGVHVATIFPTTISRFVENEEVEAA